MFLGKIISYGSEGKELNKTLTSGLFKSCISTFLKHQNMTNPFVVVFLGEGVMQFLQSSLAPDGRYDYRCTLCGRSSWHRGNMKKHMIRMHAKVNFLKNILPRFNLEF